MACSTCEARRRLNDPDATPEEIEEANAVLAAAAEAAAKATLESLYDRAVNTNTDINQHVPKLKELAEQCSHVTDIGMRPDVSSIGLLAGQPETMLHFLPPRHAPRPWAKRDDYAHVRGNTDVRVFNGNTPAIDLPEETDLLFLDTKHTANQIYLELTKYAPRVRRYIVRHDTAIFGDTGEDGGPGLKVGIRQYIRDHQEWSIVYETDQQYGLMVLSRDDRDKEHLPSLGRQAFNFSRHLFKTATEGSDHVPEDVFNDRLDKCLMCPLRVGNRCSKCGCFLDHNEALGTPGKAAYAAEECPVGKWPKYEP